MPIITFKTNLPETKVPHDFEVNLAHAVANSMSIPPEKIIVIVQANTRLSSNLSRDAFAQCTVKAIQPLYRETNDKYAAIISQICHEMLHLDSQHILIDFVKQDPDMVAIRGQTITTLTANNK